ncbi:MAG: hypothetical protein ABI165_05570 [Bryobacteraceae bacterium]
MNWRLLEDRIKLDYLELAGVKVYPGSRVRLHPGKGGDIFDLALAGQVATVQALEEDYEGRRHVAVVIEDDPGRDLGMLRQPGHLFFFSPEEVEPLPANMEEPQA